MISLRQNYVGAHRSLSGPRRCSSFFSFYLSLSLSLGPSLSLSLSLFLSPLLSCSLSIPLSLSLSFSLFHSRSYSHPSLPLSLCLVSLPLSLSPSLSLTSADSSRSGRESAPILFVDEAGSLADPKRLPLAPIERRQAPCRLRRESVLLLCLDW